MTGLDRSTVSPSISTMTRSTPWVDGCDGPRLRIMLSSSGVSTSRSSALSSTPSGRRSTDPDSQAELPLGRPRAGRHLLDTLVGLGLQQFRQLRPTGGDPAQEPVDQADLAGGLGVAHWRPIQGMWPQPVTLIRSTMSLTGPPSTGRGASLSHSFAP